MPSTANELKAAAEGNSMAAVEQFAIKGSLQSVKSRLKEYAERCLSMQAYGGTCGINGCSKRNYATFIPRFEPMEHGLRFVLHRQAHGELPVKSMPPDGMYVMVAEAETTSGRVKGHIWAPKMGYGDLLGSTKGWMTGTQKTCPDL